MKRPIEPATRVTLKGLRVCSHCRAKKCHRARPLCRAMRKLKPNQAACSCHGYHFTHRIGSPRCQSNRNHATAMWAELDKEVRVIR